MLTRTTTARLCLFTISASIFLLSCSIPQTENQTVFSPILVRRYNAEIDLGKEQMLHNPQLAIEYFNSAIEKNLDLPEAFVGRGTARLTLEQYALAIKDLDIALEANWSFYNILSYDYNAGKSNIYLLKALAGIGFLTTLDPKKEILTEVLIRVGIIQDLNMAELFAGWAGDHELMKKITKTRKFWDSAK